MKLFNTIFFDSVYKIKLIGMATNIIEKLLIFDIHNELYVLRSEINNGLTLEKLNSTKNLYDMLDNYSNFSTGYKEIIREESQEPDFIYKSNLFGITKHNVIETYNLWSLQNYVSKDELISYISTLLYHRNQLFLEFDPDDIKIICK